MCASQIWNDVMLLDPRVQIAGFIFLMDMSNMQLRELQQMSDQNVSELSCKYFQVMVLKEGLQQAYDAVAGLQDVMPKEYGGQNATTDEIYGWLQHVLFV
ncbi:unnamed protein product [Dibothriocephalus latus]|uniref:Uncharacterized protein n=1 Tax=Dibothriocephalus latus TaxID=60516 RepID=A0A3P7R0M7_DIBLA|nr:unnamed protein product [Dibothriocephalus latus]